MGRKTKSKRKSLQAQQTAVRGLIGGGLPAVYETHASSNTLQANFVPSLCSLLGNSFSFFKKLKTANQRGRSANWILQKVNVLLGWN